MPFFKGAHNFIVNGDNSTNKHATKEEATAHASQVTSEALKLASSLTSSQGLTSGVQFSSQAISQGVEDGSRYVSTTSGTAAFQGFVSPLSSTDMGNLQAELANMNKQLQEKNERKAKKAEERARNGGRRRNNGGGGPGGSVLNGGNLNELPGNGAQAPIGMLPPPGMNLWPPMNGLQFPPETLTAFMDHQANGLSPSEALNAMIASGIVAPPPMTPDGLPQLPQFPIDPHAGQLPFTLPQPGFGPSQIPPPALFPMQNHPTGGASHPNQLPINVASGQQPNPANANPANSYGGNMAPHATFTPPR
ncbi:hypothetical protein P691DRAFT_762224 [Macrolepiota fuliginosa MF-IS2]|uniref:Uncharacterized protein n=1 Tax=Macrolepiota fuliginosa MF-IS2 TaxID=1400762 RepID=A0A9P6C1W1_9AGAR|nr:hypothetical protein P691DRAFT_762224 [Macrolepiota fuliginosa MF-IS2]